MNNRLRTALRATRHRCAPRIGLVGDHRELFRDLKCRAVGSWHVQESSPSPGWVARIGYGLRLRPYTAAPTHCPLVDEDQKLKQMKRKHLVDEDDEVGQKLSHMERRRDVRAAQRTFMEYLHVTRGMCFSDAEHISKHSPVFLSKLLEKVKDAVKEPAEGGDELTFRSKVKKRDMMDQRVSKALVRLFNFHPVNEVEPFLESIGLQPNECNSLLHRGLMFLADDEKLLENYRVLCNYGIARSKIGRIYRDATDVFSFGHGVLPSKLKALEELGFTKSSVIKLVISTPVVLLRDPNAELKILQWLDDIGIQRDWISKFLSARKSYNWRKMIQVPQFFSDLGFTKEDIGKLVKKNPDCLLDGSGKMLFALVLIMLKAGSGKKELFDLFLDYPNVPVENFTRNLRRAMLFLAEIGISNEDISKLVLSNVSMLGSAPVKKPNSILTHLNVGKRRLCKIIMEDPQLLKNYTLGSKLDRLPKCDTYEVSFNEKMKFLKSIGFVEGSEDLNKALKSFRGKGDELQGRYNFLVQTGFDPKDVAHMIRMAPQVLNQRIDVLQSKISFLVNDTGYPLSDLIAFPAYLSFTVERTKVRVFMYNWLLERGVVTPKLALSTVLACSDKYFMKYFVKKHSMGPQVWENLRREVASAKNMPCT